MLAGTAQGAFHSRATRQLEKGNRRPSLPGSWRQGEGRGDNCTSYALPTREDSTETSPSPICPPVETDQSDRPGRSGQPWRLLPPSTTLTTTSYYRDGSQSPGPHGPVPAASMACCIISSIRTYTCKPLLVAWCATCEDHPSSLPQFLGPQGGCAYRRRSAC